MARLNQCSSCKGFLPRQRETCPHCGHKSAQTSRIAIGVAAGIGLALAPGCGGPSSPDAGFNRGDAGFCNSAALYGVCLLVDVNDGGVVAGTDGGD